MEIAKRILTKEKIDRQFSGQLTSTPFISIKHNHVHDKSRVLFYNQTGFDNKRDKLTAMMSKLATQSNNQGRQLKPQVYQRKGWVQGRSNYYDGGRQQRRYISHRRDRFSNLLI